MFKTPLLCDRRVYDKRGKWKSPNNDIAENIFYFIKEPMTLIASYNAMGQEELKPSLTITMFGGKPIAKEDSIFLEDNQEFKVIGITINYIESNILLKDKLKQRIASMELELE